jgi:transglutaminase-like putative cysteine protease
MGTGSLARVPLNLQRQQSTLNDTAASTAQTARAMCEHIRRDAGSPIVRATAKRIASESRCTDAQSCARAVWLYVKQVVRFKSDDAQIARLFGERDQLELLIAPAALLSMHQPEGDCDDFTMLACALLTALGIRAQVVCLCCDRSDPGRFSHVCARAFIPEQNAWLSIDASHGAYPGWKVPARDIFREQDYDLNGHCAADVVLARPVRGNP